MSELLNPISKVIDRNEKVLDRTQEAIRAADTKTGILVAVATAMVGATLLCIPAPEYRNSNMLIIAFAAIALPVFQMMWCLHTTIPHNNAKKTSLIYYGEICQKTLEDFVKDAANADDVVYQEDLLNQVHRNSQIASAKHGHLKIGLGMMWWAIPIWGVLTCLLLYLGTNSSPLGPTTPFSIRSCNSYITAINVRGSGGDMDTSPCY
ncbi:MAG: DUF5706 domain-containing protein [Planctomycetes bacterium]|nr:DUF5706 domain-containing protein [Planctomycetota bacterium]